MWHHNPENDLKMHSSLFWTASVSFIINKHHFALQSLSNYLQLVVSLVV
jgi:hypothetical protein